MKEFIDGVRTCFQTAPAILNFPNEAFGDNLEPPYVVWFVMNAAGDVATETYARPQGGASLYLRTHSWGATHAAAWSLHDAVATRFEQTPVVPTGHLPLHRPRLVSSQSLPDKTTKHYQVVATWYFRWDRT